MSDFTHDGVPYASLPAGRRPGFAVAIEAAWRWLTAPVRSFFERELVLRELGGLTDRDLADIGLSRSDVPAVVRGLYRRGLAGRKLDPDLD